MISFILFIVYAYICFYIPGRTLLWGVKYSGKQINQSILSWVSGTAVFLLLSYLAAVINQPKLPLLILVALLPIFVWKKLYTVKINFITLDRRSLGIILLGTVAFLSLDIFSGLQIKQGLQFFGTNSVDGFILLSYIQNMVNHFPPTRPGMAGIEMRGYHYLYPFLLSRFTLFFGFNPIDLLFRYFPAYISLLYGASFYFFADHKNATKAQKHWIVFFAYFGHTFIPFVSNSVLLYTGVVDPIGLIHNPSWILAIIFVLTGWALLLRSNVTMVESGLAGLCIGLVAQTKVYAGIIGVGGIAILTLYQVIKSKKIKPVLPFVIAGIIASLLTAITYLPSNWGEGKLVWAPGLYYEHFMAQDMLDNWHWYIKKVLFVEKNNIPRLIILYAQAISLFWLLSIGNRFVILYKAKEIYSRKLYTSPSNVLLLGVIGVAIFIPSFWIQSQGVFDIGQFLWLAVVLLAIPAGISLADVAKSTLWKPVKIAIILLVLATAMLGYVQDVQKNAFTKPGKIISNSEVAIMKTMQKAISPNEFIILVPAKSSDGKIVWPEAPYISAITGRAMYYEKGSTPYNTYGKEIERLAKLEIIDKSLTKCDIPTFQQTMATIPSKNLVLLEKYNCVIPPDLLQNKQETATVSFYQFK